MPSSSTRRPPRAAAPARAASDQLERERGARPGRPGGGEHEQRRARALRGAGEPRPGRGARGRRDTQVEHDEPEAAGAEEDLGGAERVGDVARPDPQRARERHAGGARRLGIERVLGIDPGDGLARARGAGRDATGEAGAPGAARADELRHPPARQPALERRVEGGQAGGQPRLGNGRRRPEANGARTTESVEQGGGGRHGP